MSSVYRDTMVILALVSYVLWLSVLEVRGERSQRRETSLLRKEG